MPKAIVTDAILSSISSRADGSCGFRGVTPELTSPEKVALMELHGKSVRLLIEPNDYEAEGKVTVAAEMNVKTPSQRLRAIIFCQFKDQKPDNMTFDEFYARRMNLICEQEKQLLEPRE